MTTPNEVVISGERHLIIHGQLGNLGAALEQLNQMCIDREEHELVERVGEAVEELDYLRKVYPQMDGSVSPVGFPDKPRAEASVPAPINGIRQKHKLINALKDMRVLMDAAHLAYVTEGAISCHLKVMLDEAFGKAGEVAGFDSVDDIPF